MNDSPRRQEPGTRHPVTDTPGKFPKFPHAASLVCHPVSMNESSLLFGERVFMRTGRVAHLLSPSPQRVGGTICGRWPGFLESWLGTGNQSEHDRAQLMPLCQRCAQAVKDLGTFARQGVPGEATWCRMHLHWRWCEHNGGCNCTVPTDWHEPHDLEQEDTR
jgi:hypothetical protein